MGNKRIIKVCDGKIYFNETDYIPFSQSNFPETIMFSSSIDIYWTVIIQDHDVSKGSVNLKVLDYSGKKTSTFLDQKLKNKAVLVRFHNLNWSYLEPLLSAYKKQDLLTILDPKTLNLEPQPKKKNKQTIKSSKFKQLPFEQDLKLDDEKNNQSGVEDIPIFNIRNESSNVDEFSFFKMVEVPFTEIVFVDGAVTFSKTFNMRGQHQEVDFAIQNIHVSAKYKYIKAYFPKALNKKSINVKICLKIVNGETIKKLATSKDIDRINEDIISSIQMKRTIDITKKRDEGTQKIYSLTDLLPMDSSLGKTIFGQSEEDVIMTIVNDQGNIRNKKQLQYLTQKQQSINYKIKFTLKPMFGFLFFMEGKNDNYFCWELLESHATYIWKCDISIKIPTFLEEVEESISLIEKSGRQKYKSYIKSNSHNFNFKFKLVSHSKANSNPAIAFAIWKKKLLEILV